MKVSIKSLAAILCALSCTEAVVKTDQATVIDYSDVTPTLQYNLYSDRAGDMYATGDATNEKYLSNILVKEASVANNGTLIATLLDLVSKYTNKAGVKTAVALDPKKNYTVSNENAADAPDSPFYIFITKDATPITVIDANIATKVSGKHAVVVMSSFPQLTLSNFNTGASENVSVSVATPDVTSGDEFIVKQAAGSMSIGKLYGPIVSVKPFQSDNAFSFEVSTKEGNNVVFTPGASLAFSSPGSGAGQTNYAHPLLGKELDVVFTPEKKGDIFGASGKAAYTILQGDQGPTIVFTGGSTYPYVTGSSGRQILKYETPTEIRVHWEANDRGFLAATFDTSPMTQPTTTTTEASTTTTQGSSSIVGLASLMAVVFSLLVRN